MLVNIIGSISTTFASDRSGVPFSGADLKNINALNKIERKDDVMGASRKALQEMTEKERQMGYQSIWALQ
jgi:hypothetical protein